VVRPVLPMLQLPMNLGIGRSNQIAALFRRKILFKR
jgi:hypothetical protein